MKKRVKNLLVLSLFLALLLTACSPVGQGDVTITGSTSGSAASQSAAQSEEQPEDPNVNPPGQLPICKEKITLTVAMPQSANVQDYETNELTKWFEEQANIEFKFDLLPAKDAKQKIQLMVSGGGELPDVIIGIDFGNIQLIRFAQSNAIIPLENYIDKYGYHIKKMFETCGNPDLRKLLTAADGSIYALPKYIQSTANEWSLRTWINADWLDKLNLSMPSTTEEFYQVLKAFKTMDPNGNGKADEIPYVGSTNTWQGRAQEFLFNAFIFNDTSNRFLVSGGKLDVAYNKDEWRDALKYMNKLCMEDLFSPLSFTQDQAQLKQMVENPGDVLVGCYAAGNIGAIIGANNDLSLQYKVLPPLTGPNGVCWTAKFPSMPTNGFIITSSCKYPLAAFMWGDLMVSEEASLRSRFGVPEKDWVKPNPDELNMYGTTPAYIKPILVWGGVQNSHWSEGAASFRTYDMTDGQVWDGNPKNSQYRNVDAVKYFKDKAPEEFVSLLTFTIDEADEISEIQTTINSYVDENIARFVTGDRNINSDSEWDAYKNELEKIGLRKYLEISQKAYDRMNGK